jgi:phosphocarrier protein HPr
MEKIIKKYTVQNARGLHARRCAVFIRIANEYPCDISVTKDGETVNGKSIIGLLTLAASKGSELIVALTGGGSLKCAKKLEKVFEQEEEVV